MRQRIVEDNIFDKLAPQSVNGAAVTSSYADMSKAVRYAAIVNTEAIGTGESVAIQIMEAKDSTGTGAQAITGATLTLGEGKNFGIVEVMVDNMTDGFTHLATRLTVTGTVVVSAVLVRSDLVNRPADQTADLKVLQIS